MFAISLQCSMMSILLVVLMKVFQIFDGNDTKFHRTQQVIQMMKSRVAQKDQKRALWRLQVISWTIAGQCKILDFTTFAFYSSRRRADCNRIGFARRNIKVILFRMKGGRRVLEFFELAVLWEICSLFRTMMGNSLYDSKELCFKTWQFLTAIKEHKH